MELQCLLSRPLHRLSQGWFLSPLAHFIERRGTFEEFEPTGRTINRKLYFTIEGLQQRHAACCCHSVLTKDRGTETQGRSLPFDCDHDVNLINIEESNNGFVLFKFGTPGTCEDSSMPTPTTELKTRASAVSTVSEYLSDMIDSRNLDDSCGLPSTSLRSFDFEKAYHDSNPRRDFTSGPMGQIFGSPFFECKGSSFGPMCTAGNTGEEPFDKFPIPDVAKTKPECTELLRYPPIFTKVPQPVKSPGCFSSGSEGRGIITSVGHDGFHFKSPHGVEVRLVDETVHEGMDSTIMTEKNKESSMYSLPGDAVMGKPNLSSQGACSVKETATKSVQRTKKKGGLGQRKSGKVVTRDICRRSSFQLYEIILSYPFTNSREAVSNFQTVPKEEFGELFNIFNQIAIGLAGSGLALVLFVASRMLSLNATLDSSKLLYLLRGVGLLWFSSALHKCGGAVRCMADVCSQARSQRKESLAKFRREVQAVTFKACALVVLSIVRVV